MKIVPTIGMETHVELKTNSKMFCRCNVVETDKPNENLCPTCLGLPGSLPVPNKRAIEFITLLALSTKCQITTDGMFHRKNYFYPDLPKNYQISQFDLPVGTEGSLEIVVNGEFSTVEIERVHMEEDTGKSTHIGSGRIDSATSTHLDFNRAGIPLVEVVTKPLIKSSKEAVSYIEELRQLVIDLDISEGKLEKGNLRFDANISVAYENDDELGTKVEIKNMNSLRSLEKAIEYEISRQTKMLNNNETIIQETRHWDEKKEVTSSMRSKEGSADYRYFSDPDIPNMILSEDFIDKIKNNMPVLPSEKRNTFINSGLSIEEANSIGKSPKWMGELYKSVSDITNDSKTTFNWITGELQGQLRKLGETSPPEWMTAEQLAEIISLVKNDKISFTSGKEILAELIEEKINPEEYAISNKLIQENDTEEISKMVKEIIKENSEVLERIANGEEKLIGFLVGQVIKLSNGKVNPSVAKELLLKEIK
ncbi:MAG: Asp-tRNA(Asn)/Glu-tRNA(Gln) amidotransferase subunit GatB [Candidatus Actinomarina sp.]|nr:Asp-tRNA(Asn)/Glu-tRNA(Gln) amidotransferase subunit GatB [Actinomycetota bacterium]MBL6833205.1 Asp-tRNA(Asn)/Glu-tRNA(Gln) amidotransferase subunit GatB [Candidatus Actinomarina sp.]MBL6836725.1 Asp-tRNA(Asn)/Glu-tRNA(Gln) amidotransferase subunit GatB [Candidatus Actinomarina sp.]